MTTTKSPSLYARKLERAGLSRKACGISCVRLLVRLSKGRLIVRYGVDRDRRTIALNKPNEIGTLIRNGLARLSGDREGYEITAEGIAYVKSLEAANLIPGEGDE